MVARAHGGSLGHVDGIQLFRRVSDTSRQLSEAAPDVERTRRSVPSNGVGDPLMTKDLRGAILVQTWVLLGIIESFERLPLQPQRRSRHVDRAFRRLKPVCRASSCAYPRSIAVMENRTRARSRAGVPIPAALAGS